MVAIFCCRRLAEKIRNWVVLVISMEPAPAGIKGGWNFLIGWSSVNQGAPRANPNQTAADVTEPTGLTSYEAVERQLGVKLVKQKRSIRWSS
jgi:hypothetical protein